MNVETHLLSLLIANVIVKALVASTQVSSICKRLDEYL